MHVSHHLTFAFKSEIPSNFRFCFSRFVFFLILFFLDSFFFDSFFSIHFSSIHYSSIHFSSIRLFFNFPHQNLLCRPMRACSEDNDKTELVFNKNYSSHRSHKNSMSRISVYNLLRGYRYFQNGYRFSIHKFLLRVGFSHFRRLRCLLLPVSVREKLVIIRKIYLMLIIRTWHIFKEFSHNTMNQKWIFVVRAVAEQCMV